MSLKKDKKLVFQSLKTDKYLKRLNINFEKLRSTYYFNIMLKDKYKDIDPILDRFCEIRKFNYDNCGDLTKLELFMNNNLINEVFYNGNAYSVYLYKIDPK